MVAGVPDGGVDMAEVAAVKSHEKAAVHGRVLGGDGCDLRGFEGDRVLECVGCV